MWRGRKLSVLRAVFTSLVSIIMLVHVASWVKVAQKHPGRRKNLLVGPSKDSAPPLQSERPVLGGVQAQRERRRGMAAAEGRVLDATRWP